MPGFNVSWQNIDIFPCQADRQRQSVRSEMSFIIPTSLLRPGEMSVLWSRIIRLSPPALSQCYENGLHCLHWVCNAYFFGNIVYIWSAFKQICLLFGISLTFFAHIYYISLTSLYYVILLVCRLQITTEPNGGLAVMVQLTRQKSLYYTIIISSPPAGSQDLSAFSHI